MDTELSFSSENDNNNTVLSIDKGRNNAKHMFDLIRSGNWDEFLQWLSQQSDGFDVNVRDNSNTYPIQYAIMYNKINVVNALIERECKLDVIDEDGRSLLYPCVKMRYDDLLLALLEASSQQIGQSPIAIVDDKGRTILHWSVIYSNHFAIDALLKYGATADIRDIKRGHTPLHLAVFTKNIEMLEHILLFKPKLDMQCTTGETALHIACNFGMDRMVDRLLVAGANPNVADWDTEFTPIIYCVTHNRLDMIEMLRRYGADVNRQDLYGNSPLHYAVYEERWQILSNLSKDGGDINLVNIEGRTPVHLLLTLGRKDEVSEILETVELNTVDDAGRTPFWWIIENGWWEEWSERLGKLSLDLGKVLKYENLLIANKKKGVGTEPIEALLAKGGKSNEKVRDQLPLFLKMLENSWIARLKREPSKWTDEWMRNCNKDEAVCRRRVREELQKGNWYAQSTQIEILPGNRVKFGTFTGTTLDVLFGLIYLLQKWNNVATLTHDPSNNPALNSHYIQNSIDVAGEFLNFEVVWVYGKLFLPSDTTGCIDRFMKNSKLRFLVAPLGIETDEGSHANYLIYDKDSGVMERFEPHGALAPEKMDYRPLELDAQLEEQFGQRIKNLTYLKPSGYLPRIGFQLFDNFEHNRYRNIGDPGGFCALWCIWYTDLRMNYKHLSQKKLVKKLLDRIRTERISFRNLIRDFSSRITNLRDGVIDKLGFDINDWLNGLYSEEARENLGNEIVKLLPAGRN
jgi:ankyrin repeat protein